jgi:hypothetical protein
MKSICQSNYENSLGQRKLAAERAAKETGRETMSYKITVQTGPAAYREYTVEAATVQAALKALTLDKGMITDCKQA